MPAGNGARTAGKSLLEQMWDLLDEVMDKLMVTGGTHLKGRAYGIAQCLALISDPMQPSVDDVRTVAMARWEARQNGEEYAHPGDGRHNETAAELEQAVERKRRRGQTRVRPY